MFDIAAKTCKLLTKAPKFILSRLKLKLLLLRVFHNLHRIMVDGFVTLGAVPSGAVKQEKYNSGSQQINDNMEYQERHMAKSYFYLNTTSR